MLKIKTQSGLIKAMLNQALFIKVMLFLMLTTNFPYIGNLSLFIMRLITVVWSPIILIFNLKKIKNVMRKNFYWLLLLMICSYSITILINYKYNFFRNAKALMWFVIYVGILLIWWENSEKNCERFVKDIKQINWIVIIVNMLNVVPTIILYIIDVHIRYDDRTIGLYAPTNRLFGVMEGLNPSVMLSFISILAIAMNYQIGDRVPEKRAVCLIDIVCSYIYIIGSGTRSVKFIMITMVAFYAFVKLWEKQGIEAYFKSKVKAAIQSIIGGLIVFILAYAVVELTRYPIGMMHISNIEDYLKNDKNELTIRVSESEESSFLERYTIWKECIDLWQEHPFFGTGNANMKVYADSSKKEFRCINDEENASDYGLATHNMPLSVLLFSGIIGAIFFLGYMILRMITAFIILLSKDGSENIAKSGMLFSFMICISLCMYGMLGNVIIFTHVNITIVFWIYLSIMELSEYELEIVARTNSI